MSTVQELSAPGLDESHARFRARVRAVLEREVLPHADGWERQRQISAEGWRALADEGLLALPHAGAGFLDSAVFLEELGRTGYAGIRAAVGVHAYMAASYLTAFGSPKQRERYLSPARRGEHVAALAITEADAGSDLRRLTTTAVADGDGGYRVTGVKRHVANGSRAGFYVTVVANAEAASPGLAGASLFVIDADLPGVTRTPQQTLGWLSADVCQVDFADVPVSSDHLIGRPGRALIQLMSALDFERLVAGLLAVGGALFCVELLKELIRTHRIGDAPLSAKQTVRHRVADLDAELELVRHYGYHAAWSHSQGKLSTRTASILKLRATELAVAAAEAFARYSGARGYQQESTAARLYRDSLAGVIAAGPSEVMRDLVSGEM
jgi:alkylation response protein AidB-like acyl-CoA dehydrogenase